MAFARVAMLLAANRATTLIEAQRRCREELRGLPGTSAAGPWHALAQALEARNARQSAPLVLSIGPADAFASLMSLAAFSWAQSRHLDVSQYRTLESWAQAYAAGGDPRAALEVRAGRALAAERVVA